MEEIKEKVREIEQKLQEKRTDYIRAKEACKSCMSKAIDALNKISEEIKSDETYKRCKELMEGIWKLVRKITHYRGEAIKFLGYFKPFSYRRKVVPLSSGYYLVVGNLIYRTSQSDRRRYPLLEESFQTFVRYGELIIPNVRKTIREDLAEFYPLAKALTAELDFRGDFIAREGRFRTLSLLPYVEGFCSPLIEWEIFGKISIYIDLTYSPGIFRIILFDSKNNKNMEDMGTVLVNSLRFLELYDVLADMCDEARRKLLAKKERCERIIKKMREIVAPFVLSEL